MEEVRILWNDVEVVYRMKIKVHFEYLGVGLNSYFIVIYSSLRHAHLAILQSEESYN